MNRHFLLGGMLLAALATLGGCGTKGPLVLPPKPAASQPATPAAAPADLNTPAGAAR